MRFLAQYIPWYHYQACICYALSIFKDFINKKSRLNQRIDTVDQKSLERLQTLVLSLNLEADSLVKPLHFLFFIQAAAALATVV